MAHIDDLVSQVRQDDLRTELEAALAVLKSRQRFGLTFEEHIPETTALHGLALSVGFRVQRRAAPASSPIFRVTLIDGDQVTIEPEIGGRSETALASDLLLIKRFGEPTYPALCPLGNVQGGTEDKPAHAVINGENFDALQLMVYMYEGQVDCIYLDPPYNTGARDWKYNNDYVDSTDNWRHSKWLSFMEKRLKIAKRLLKPDGVLIITIDEHEVHHLGMLLERLQLFPEPHFLRYMVTIVINPKGTYKANFARMDEQAFFIVPDLGENLITGQPSGQFTTSLNNSAEEDDTEETSDDEEINDDLDDIEVEGDEQVSILKEEGIDWEYWSVRRSGAESSFRHQRVKQFYPIYVDEEKRVPVCVGPSIPLEDEPDFEYRDGLRPLWPIDGEGNHRTWRYNADSMQKEIDLGNIIIGKYNQKKDSWTLKLRRPKKLLKRLKTVWWETRHDAGKHGTELINKMLGKPGLFPFPKSVYAVQDCLAAVVRDRPNALIIDVFAGSGTTFHATCLLNAELGGQRRSILVTNNEVSEKTAKTLHKQGYYKGDPEFEAHGIFEQATRPRCEAAVTGKRPDGTRIPGAHIGGRPLAQGFSENIEFYKLEYLDRDEVEMRRQFEAILPALWLTAGGVGAREIPSKRQAFSLPEGGRYGVLFNEAQFRAFREAIEQRPDVTHAWLVTDSEEAFAEMRANLPSHLTIFMLYRDYLRSFQINTEQTL